MATTTSDLLDAAKKVYGLLYENLTNRRIIYNLCEDGSKVAKRTREAGILGYTFGVRLGRNWRHGFRAEGTTGVGSAGTPNIRQATVNLKYSYIPIEITGQALQLSQGDVRAFIQARALHARFSITDYAYHIDVLLSAGARGGRLATVAASPAPGAGTFSVTKGNGLDALFLIKDMPIDVAPVAGGTLSVNDSQIASVDYVTGAITHASGTANAGEGVFLAGEAASTTGAFPLTAEPLDVVIDDGTVSGNVFQAIDSSTYAGWKSQVFAEPADLNVSLLDFLCGITQSRSGEEPDMGFLSLAQRTSYTLLGLANLRFNVDQVHTEGQKRALKLGFEAFQYGNVMFVVADNIRPPYLYIGQSGNLVKFDESPLQLADDGAGEWTRIIGSAGIADAVAGLYRHYFQLGTIHRASFAKATKLSVPEFWVDKPPVIA